MNPGAADFCRQKSESRDLLVKLLQNFEFYSSQTCRSSPQMRLREDIKKGSESKPACPLACCQRSNYIRTRGLVALMEGLGASRVA